MVQQIAGHKVEMCKSEYKVKLMPFPSFRKSLESVFLQFALKHSLFPKCTVTNHFSFLQEISQKMHFSGKRLHFRGNCKKTDPT